MFHFSNRTIEIRIYSGTFFVKFHVNVTYIGMNLFKYTLRRKYGDKQRYNFRVNL